MVLGCFRTPGELYAIPLPLNVQNISQENFNEALRLLPFGRYLVNSLILCGGTVAGQLVICSLAAYSLSKLRVKFGGGVLLLFLTSLMVPFEVLIIPLYLIMKNFPLGMAGSGWNLLNTYWALILPGVFSAFAILVMKDFIDGIPNEIVYAARIDGCTEMGLFFRFILPMSGSILAILAVFGFVTAWNGFFWPLIVLNNPDYYPLMLGVQKLVDAGEPWNVVVASLTLATIPSVLLLIIFQRWLIRGIAYSGIYG
jgi:multiple sugar transport system permease protein